MPRYPQRLAWIDLLLRELDRGSVPDPMHTALLLDGLAHTFALLTGPANRPAAPPTWLLEAAASRYPRLAQELDRDWTDIEEEFTKAVTTVLRGAEPMSRRRVSRRRERGLTPRLQSEGRDVAVEASTGHANGRQTSVVSVSATPADRQGPEHGRWWDPESENALRCADGTRAVHGCSLPNAAASPIGNRTPNYRAASSLVTET